jgi:Fe-S cluster biogenesis protein NfuA
MDSNITWSSGGAVFFNDTVSNLIVNATFSGNVAEWNGGAIRFEKNVNNVTVDGNYTNNKAQYGAVLSFGGESDNVNIFGYYYNNNANETNIIELNNIVRNSLFNGVFVNNTADNGSCGIFLNKSVSDCTFSGVFINNTAINGAALFYNGDVNNTIIKNAVFLNNKAISDSVTLTENDGIVEIKFYGAHDFLNAIWCSNDLSFDNVTYWGENGIMNTGTKTIPPSQLEAGQNITITINKTGEISQKTMQTDANGTITLDLRNDQGKYIITAYHPDDAYYTESNHTSINFTIDKQSSTIDLSTEKNKVIANVTAGATGNVTFTARKDNVDVKTETISLINSIAEFDLNDLEQGEYNITAVYNGDENYYSSSNTTNITVSPTPGPDRKNLTLNASAEPIVAGDNATIIVTGFENATGTVTARIQGGPLSAPIVNGTATFIVPGLTLNTTAYIIYGGDANYNPANTTVEIIVYPNPDKKNLTLEASAEPIMIGDNATIIVTGFENATGKVTARIQGGPLSASIVNGTATFIVPGLTLNTTAYIIYEGDDEYNAASTTVNITVNPKSDVVIVAENVTKYYHGPERFVANIYNPEGNPLVNKSVNITINGVTYTKISDANGTVSIGINLGSGTYDVTTKVDNTTVKSSITVLSTLTGKDIIKYYRNGTQYSVQVFDTAGKAVGKGEVVTFNINGVFYNRTTDENGIATLNINLPQGEYVITAINPVTGEMHANNITVLPVLAANDLTMKYLDGNQFKANLVDGQGKPYAEQFVTFNINGILYNRLTDSNGQAALNIRLPPGEYIITSSFNGCNIANKITVMGVL